MEGKRLTEPKQMTKILHSVRNIHNLKELLNSSYQLYPNHLAFKYKAADRSTIVTKTYTNLKQDVDALGTSLLHLGLKNKKIIVISNNRYEWCVSYLATVNGVGTIVPFDRLLPEEELINLVKKTNPSCILFEEKFTSLLESLKEQLPQIEYLISFEQAEDSASVLSYSLLIEKGKQLLQQGYTDYVTALIDDDSPTTMIYTSGTTSTSKAVLLTPKNIAFDIVACAQVVKYYDTDTLLSFLPIHHTFECTATFLLGLYSGSCIAFCDGMKSIVPNLKEYEVSVFLAVPLVLETIYKSIMKASQDKKIPPTAILKNLAPNLRLFIVGAASIDKEIVIGFNQLGIKAYQGYGLTEASPVVSVENDSFRKPGSIGRLLPGIQGKIVDPDEEGIGEIVIKSPTVMLGYCNNPEATNEVLKDRWLYTGDLGYFDEEDNLYITGRKKSVIVLKNGKNVFPEEIESVINNCPYILESFVYSTKRKTDSEQLCAKIVYNQDYFTEKYGTITEEQKREIIHQYLKEVNKTLPLYKYIRDFSLTTEPLIKTTTNKIKRYEEWKKIS